MYKREEILFELNGISKSVASIRCDNVLSVHEEYFTFLPQIIMAKINAEYSFNTFQAPTVPEGYFENLAYNILKKIQQEENNVSAELKNLSPLLSSIQKKETYTVPTEYFNQLAFFELPQERAKVVSINKPRSFFKYAAAAVITGLLGLSIVNMVDNNQQNGITTAAEIITRSAQPKAILIDGNFNEALQHVSDNEIEQYLQKSGQDVNAALVASSTDDIDKLPEAGEYLLDENVLENYLKKNNLNN